MPVIAEIPLNACDVHVHVFDQQRFDLYGFGFGPAA